MRSSQRVEYFCSLDTSSNQPVRTVANATSQIYLVLFAKLLRLPAWSLRQALYHFDIRNRAVRDTAAAPSTAAVQVGHRF